MSSSTPGSDRTSAPSPGEGAGNAQTGGSADRSAIRTSLAERFAAAKAETQVTAPQAPSSPIDETVAAPAGTGPTPTSPASAPAAPGPRYGATATTSTAPQATAPQATGSTRLGEDPGPAARARAAAQPPSAGRPNGARKVRLSIARVDPWSVMKLSFLMSIAIGIGIIVASAAMWFLLDSMHVFADIRDLLVTLGSADFLQLMEYAEFDRVMSLAAIIAVVDILLITALATLGAFLYNIVAALVGGLHMTLTDD